jgi:hypothetical protein
LGKIDGAGKIGLSVEFSKHPLRVVVLGGMNTYQQATKRASDLVVGDYVCERDGAEFQVESLERKGAYINFVLANVHHYMSAGAMLKARVKATSLVCVRPTFEFGVY